MGNRTLWKSVGFVLAVFVVLLAVGAVASSSPSDATVARAAAPTTTTTTEPPPEGSVLIRLNNGSFRPSNVRLDLDVEWIVKWRNEDPREYILRDTEGLIEEPLPPGGEYEFDYSTVEPGLYRVFAEIGFQRIPGTIDTRPQQ